MDAAKVLRLVTDALKVFGFADVFVKKLGRLLEEITDDDCTILLCGFFCQPCLIAQALEEVGENWWFTCCTVTFAPNCFGFPYLCWTIPVRPRNVSDFELT